MAKIKLDSDNFLSAYNNATDENVKKAIKDLAGDQVDFTPKNIMDRVLTFEDACKALKINPAEVHLPIELADAFKNDTKSIAAYMKLIIIIRALNEGWVPDWSNTNTNKYYVWFIHNTGFGLSCLVYVCTRSSTLIGSRLCFKSKELAIYAGKQFEDIYRDYFTI